MSQMNTYKSPHIPQDKMFKLLEHYGNIENFNKLVLELYKLRNEYS